MSERDDFGTTFTIPQWKAALASGLFTPDDGSGRFLNEDGDFFSDGYDDVFGPIPDSMSGVRWYNK